MTWVNRLLHPHRREKARSQVAQNLPIQRLLILCQGNICRSPYGLARMEALSQGGPALELRSAGLMGPGRPSPENARTAARKRGLDLNGHVSQLLSPEAVAWADLLVVMAWKQAKVLQERFGVQRERILILGDLDPGSPTRRTIQDPIDRSESYFARSYERIDRCLEELFTLIRSAP